MKSPSYPPCLLRRTAGVLRDGAVDAMLKCALHDGVAEVLKLSLGVFGALEVSPCVGAGKQYPDDWKNYVRPAESDCRVQAQEGPAYRAHCKTYPEQAFLCRNYHAASLHVEECRKRQHWSWWKAGLIASDA